MNDTPGLWIGRLIVSGVVILIGIGIVWLYGVPWWAAVVFGGIAAAAGAWLSRTPDAMLPAYGQNHESGEDELALQDVADLIEQPILIVDARKRVELANASARRLLGEHIVDQDVRLAFRHPAAAALLTNGATDGSRVELLDLGGGGQRWELLADTLGKRQVVRLIDRTALSAAEKMRVDFVANASHELRTPLATLIGFIETLEGPAAEDDGARKRFLGIMRTEAQRMIRLVDDLMSLSRIEADKHHAPTTPVNLAQLAAEVKSALGHKLGKGDRTLEIDAPDPVPLVAGDRDQLLQLLYNLVGNAIKYGRKGTPVKIRIRPDGQSMVRLVVEDEGEGIPPEHLPRLTERFYRVDASRSRSVGGTGLGLAIVKHIVERHRGQLLIESEMGVGTRISALLPSAQTR